MNWPNKNIMMEVVYHYRVHDCNQLGKKLFQPFVINKYFLYCIDMF